jgi:hypothetical protein
VGSNPTLSAIHIYYLRMCVISNIVIYNILLYDIVFYELPPGLVPGFTCRPADIVVAPDTVPVIPGR